MARHHTAQVVHIQENNVSEFYSLLWLKAEKAEIKSRMRTSICANKLRCRIQRVIEIETQVSMSLRLSNVLAGINRQDQRAGAVLGKYFRAGSRAAPGQNPNHRTLTSFSMAMMQVSTFGIMPLVMVPFLMHLRAGHG